MGDYVGRIGVNRGAEETFAFLATPSNMPRYLPSVRRVEELGQGRVALEGEAGGHPWQAEGWMEQDAARRQLRWGSDALVYYRGELAVTGEGERCQVELRLHLVPLPAVAQRLAQEHGTVEAGLRAALERTLGAIQQALDPGRGRVQAVNRPYGRGATMNPEA